VLGQRGVFSIGHPLDKAPGSPFIVPKERAQITFVVKI
jgi:hypothetical protein